MSYEVESKIVEYRDVAEIVVDRKAFGYPWVETENLTHKGVKVNADTVVFNDAYKILINYDPDGFTTIDLIDGAEFRKELMENNSGDSSLLDSICVIVKNKYIMSIVRRSK